MEGKTRTLLSDEERSHSRRVHHEGTARPPARARRAARRRARRRRPSIAGQGKCRTSFNDFLITTILGDTESSSKFYWGIWVNNRYATSGACGLKPHRGDQLLFAVDSVAHHEHPLAIQRPAAGRRGQVVQRSRWSRSAIRARAKPLPAHVSLAGAGQGVVTDSRGDRARRGERRHAQAGGVRRRVHPRRAGSRARQRIGRVAGHQAHPVCGDRGRASRPRSPRGCGLGGGQGHIERQPDRHPRLRQRSPSARSPATRFPAPRP